jgi:hypothetical protein
VNVEFSGRRSGKTTKAAAFALANPKAVVLSATAPDAERLHRQFGVPRRQLMIATDLRPVYGARPEAVIVDDADRIAEQGRALEVFDFVKMLAVRTKTPVQYLASSSALSPPSSLDVETMRSWIRQQLAVRGRDVSDVKVESWRDPALQGDWLQVVVDVDGQRFGSKVLVTDERRARGWVGPVLAQAARGLVRGVEQQARLAGVDPVQVAIDVIGFDRSEVKAARLSPLSREGKLTLEVDVVGTDWEPDFELELDDVLPQRMFDVEEVQWSPAEYAQHVLEGRGQKPTTLEPWQERLLKAWLHDHER